MPYFSYWKYQFQSYLIQLQWTIPQVIWSIRQNLKTLGKKVLHLSLSLALHIGCIYMRVYIDYKSIKLMTDYTDYILCSQRWRSSMQSAETRLGADCGSDHELIVKFRLEEWKTTRPCRYDLNQIPYHYTVEVTRD